MSSATVRSGFSTWAGSALPSLTHQGDKYLRVDSGSMESFLYLNHPVPRGATVTSAKLRLHARNASTGSRSVIVRRVGSSWTLSRLTWNHKPAATGATVSHSIGTLADKDVVEIDITGLVQSFADGAPNYGLKIATSSGTAHYFYGMLSAYKPTLVVSWSDQPATPSRLSPAGTVSIAKPTLVFDYIDVGGNTTLAAVQVQIDAAADAVSPDFDSGTVLTSEPELDLTTTAYAGLADGSSTQWRVRVQDGAGLWSAWSAWATFSRATKDAVTIGSPSGGVLYDTTPPIVWTFGGTQTAYRVEIRDSENYLVHGSGKITDGAAGSYTIPHSAGLALGPTYTAYVDVWDDVDGRVSTPGDDTFSRASANFVIQRDPSTGAAATLTAAVLAGTPWVQLTFTRSTAPDSWTIIRDGNVIDALIDPGDIFVSGTTYAYVDYTAAPNRPHVYEAVAVVNSKTADDGPTATLTPEVSGIWIGDPLRDFSVGLWGDDAGDFTSDDDAAVYTPIGSSTFVRIVSGMRGLSGQIRGYLIEGFGRTFDDLEADLYAVKERPSATLRLVLGDANLPVQIGNLVVAPTPITRKGRLVKAVTFDFWQNGELPFRPRL